MWNQRRYHFIIGLVADSGSNTVQMEITKGHHYHALAPVHQYVRNSLGFDRGGGPVFSYEDVDAIMHHSKLAAEVYSDMDSPMLTCRQQEDTSTAIDVAPSRKV